MQTKADPTGQSIARAQNGDKAALEGLLRAWQPRLIRQASGLLRDREAARDVVQETFIKVVRNIDTLVDPGAFSTWVVTILRNEAWEYVRKKQRSQRGCVGYDDANLDLQSRPDGAFAASDEMEQYLGRLQNEDRKLLDLYYWCGLDVREIAVALGIATGAVKTRLFRARHRLREIICEPQGELIAH